MGITLSSDQEEFKNSIRRCFETELSPELRRKIFENSAERQKSDLWQKLLEFGLVDLFLDKEIGTYSALSLVAEECGRILMPEAVVEHLFFGPYVLLRCGKKDQLQGGKKRAAGGLVSDSADQALCLGGPAAEIFILVKGSKTGKGALLIAPKQQNFAALDPLIPASLISYAQTAEEISIGIDLSLAYRLLKVGEMYGACQKALELSVDYLKTRKQFGVPVGGFQAVQHELADAFKNIELLRALSRFAAWCAEHDQSQFELAALSALRFASKVGSGIVETCLQLHGGIGFTWEYDLHFYLRRVKLIESVIRPEIKEAERLLKAACAS
jgi:alkylation response protein AidB-like acyl-CoA dehydrogenase